MMTLRRAAIAAVLLLASIAPAPAQERILLFISDVMIERNGDLTVTETIRVQAEGKEIRRGLLRNFPTVRTLSDGTRVEVGFEVLSVTRNGSPENFATEPLDGATRVRIGHADRLIEPGPHEYVTRYRTSRQINFLANSDELIWNVTGHSWSLGIDRAEARINLPASVPLRPGSFYTGPAGSVGYDAALVEAVPGRLVFRTTRALGPREGLTVAVSWQKGVVQPPAPAPAQSK